MRLSGHNLPMIIKLALAALVLALSLAGCSPPPPAPTPTAAVLEPVSRASKIPGDAVKISPEADPNRPVLYVEGFKEPVPVPGRVNTAGAEDSPFVTPDGETLYFFFTPDVAVPVEKQILDGVTGIYQSTKAGDEWSQPERVVLQEPGKLAGDGCEFVLGDTMWFCTVREGYTGLHWFTARRRRAGEWTDWQIADFDPNYQVGELHITADNAELYFGSDRPGGRGGLDIWVSQMLEEGWGNRSTSRPSTRPTTKAGPPSAPTGANSGFPETMGSGARCGWTGRGERPN